MKKFSKLILILAICFCGASISFAEYLTVPEDYANPSGTQIDLYYRWFDGFDPEKQTLVVMNGGAGISLEFYFKETEYFSTLTSRYNILFHDTRGSGQSSRITPINMQEKNLDCYGVKEMIHDVERFRKKVIKQKSVTLWGHSFGGFTSYSYAIKYGRKAKKIFIVSSTSSMSALIQGVYDLPVMVQQVRSTIDPIILDQVDALGNTNQLEYPGFRTLTVNEYQFIQMTYIYTKHGQDGGLATLMQELYDYNINGVDISELSEYQGYVPLLSNQDLYDSFFSNILYPMWSCSHHFTQYNISELDDGPVKDFANASYDNCQLQFPTLTRVKYNPYKKLKKIKSPVVIVAGIRDVILPIQSVDDDFAKLLSLGKNVSYYPLDIGHHTYDEALDDLIGISWLHL